MLDLTTFDPMLKDHYAPGPVAQMAYQKNKALGMLNKSSKRPGGGRKWVQPISYALPGGGSSDFATAMAATNNNTEYDAAEVPRTKHYRKAQVDNETIEATASGDMDAFEPAFDEFDRAIQAESNWINFRFFRSKLGEIGKMTNTGFATAVLQLDDFAGVWGVRKGDVVRLADSTPALRTGTLTVLTVQRKAGTITMTGNISAGVAAAATNDWVILQGDFQAAPAGLADWCPDTDAGKATTLYNLARASDPDMLGGLLIDGTDGRPVHEVLIDMAVELDNIGAEPDIVFMNPRAVGTLTKQIEGKWVVTQAAGYNGKKYANIGYKGYQVTLEGHEMTIYTDRCCQTKRIWMGDWSVLTMFSAGPAPNFLQKRAGSIIKVSETADAYEARVGEYMNFASKAPGWWCVGTLA
jgi:hypothetical protein